jgi:hypothetical protein
MTMVGPQLFHDHHCLCAAPSLKIDINISQHFGGSPAPDFMVRQPASCNKFPWTQKYGMKLERVKTDGVLCRRGAA